MSNETINTDNISYKPILINSILDCANFNNYQYMRSSPIQFTFCNTIQTYQNNAPITINNISYSYNCLGVTLPFSFYLDDILNNFTSDSIDCTCSTRPLSSTSIGNINATIDSANSTIESGQFVLETDGYVSKFALSLLAIQSLGQTLNAAAITLNTIIGNALNPATTPIQAALFDLTVALEDINEAAALFSTLVGQTPPFSSTTVQAIALLIYDNTPLSDSATEFIIDGAQNILNFSGSSDAAKAAASAAITASQAAQTEATAVYSNPSTQTIGDLNTLILNTYYAALYLYNALINSIQTSGEANLQQYLNSLGQILNSLFLFLSASQDISNSSSDQNENLLDNAANTIIQSAQNVITAVDYTSNPTSVSLYNTLNSTINSKKFCNLNSCNNTSYSKRLFLQEINAFSICGLKININGCIGSDEFEAYAYYPNIRSLVDFGFDTLKLNSLLCTPNRQPFTIVENFDPCFGIQCIFATDNYSNLFPTGFFASVYSYFSLNTTVSITVKKPLPIQSANLNFD